MAYKPTHKETSMNHTNQKFIDLFFKKLKKQSKITAELYTFICRAYDEIYLTDEEFKQKLSELFGTKRYTGKDIQIGLQVKLLKKFNELKHFINN